MTMLAPVLITPPEDSPVQILDLKAHLNVTFDDDDVLIDELGRSATNYLDGWNGILGLCLVEQTWRESFDRFPGGETRLCKGLADNVLRLRLRPFMEVVSLKYYDADGVLQTVDDALYRVIEDVLGPCVGSVAGSGWPSSGLASRPDAVIVEYKAGFGAAADVPENIKTAIKQIVAMHYENREAAGTALQEMPYGVSEMLAGYKRIIVA